MSLLGELDRERKRLRLPGLGKYRPAFIARQVRQSGESLRIGNGIMLAQGSHPTWRYRQCLWAWPALPTTRALESALNKHAAASRRENVRRYPETRKRHGRVRWCRVFRARSAAGECAQQD